MKIATAAQMRELDRLAIEEYGIPGIVLMENAGRGAAECIVANFREACELGVVVACGPGNNGGDGFVIARHLFNQGFEVECLLLGARSALKGDARTNQRVAERLGIPLREIKRERDFRDALPLLAEAGLIVDALFGTGLSRAPEGLAADLIDAIDEAPGAVVAVDIPSGLSADTGRPLGAAISADLTCTFGLPKLGQVIHPGLDYCGELVTVDISLPSFLPAQLELPLHLIGEEDVIPFFAPREDRAHKGTCGHALVVAGATGMSGAAIMTSHAALLGGAGLVTLLVPQSILPAVETAAPPEVLKAGASADEAGRFSQAALDEVVSHLEGKAAVAVGPGLGRGDTVRNLIVSLLVSAKVPLVVDADGLNSLAGGLDLVRNADIPIVLTPHPGEMARLLRITNEEVEADRLAAATRLAAETGAVAVLKGARTLVAAPDGRAWINPTGNPGMATGGMGDALTGLILAFLAQGLAALPAAIAGVYVHGLAGDRAVQDTGERALTVSALLAALPEVLGSIEESHLAADLEE